MAQLARAWLTARHEQLYVLIAATQRAADAAYRHPACLPDMVALLQRTDAAAACCALFLVHAPGAAALHSLHAECTLLREAQRVRACKQNLCCTDLVCWENACEGLASLLEHCPQHVGKRAAAHIFAQRWHIAADEDEDERGAPWHNRRVQRACSLAERYCEIWLQALHRWGTSMLDDSIENIQRQIDWTRAIQAEAAVAYDTADACAARAMRPFAGHEHGDDAVSPTQQLTRHAAAETPGYRTRLMPFLNGRTGDLWHDVPVPSDYE